MAREVNEQIKELVQKSKKILITTKSKFSGDGLAACLALSLVLKKLNHNSEIIIDGFLKSRQFQFLDNLNEIRPEAVKLKKFVIDLDISQTGIEELSYDVVGDRLRIYLSPKKGVFTADDLKFQTSLFAYDLIFTLATPDLENLGKIYDNHRDLFYQIPVINIDSSAQNEQYGHINLVDITATSTCEILFKLIGQWPEVKIDDQLATRFLTGMIDATNCFKASNITPDALQIFSQLISLGAKRQLIIDNLYQNKTINTLKLWGRVLSRIQSIEPHKLIWSKLNANDFSLSGATEEDLPGVINELIANSPAVEIFLLFYQLTDNQTKVIGKSLGIHNIQTLTRSYNPIGDQNEVNFVLNKNLEESEKEVLEYINQQFK
jgi:bifunctional oligoribonuclease and PAP phosphatase NrnA